MPGGKGRGRGKSKNQPKTPPALATSSRIPIPTSPRTPTTPGTSPRTPIASGKSGIPIPIPTSPRTPTASSTSAKTPTVSAVSSRIPIPTSPRTQTASGTSAKTPTVSGKSAKTPTGSATSMRIPSASAIPIPIPSGTSPRTPTASGTSPRTPTVSGKSAKTPTGSATSSKIPILSSPRTSTASGKSPKTRTTSSKSAKTPTASDTSAKTPTTSDISAKTPTTLDTSAKTPTTSDTSTKIPTTLDTSARISTSSNISTGTSTTSETSTAPPESAVPAIPVCPPKSIDSLQPLVSEQSLSQSVLSRPISLQSRPTHLALPQQSEPEPTSQASSRGRGNKRGRSEIGHESQVAKVSATGDTSFGRGATRGKRFLCTDSLVVTRPDNLPTKKGITGNQIILQSNYFKLPSTTDWTLFQHRVDFAPEEDSIYGRKKLLKVHKERLGAYIFDGTVLYTSNRLPKNIDLLSIRESDNEKIQITIKFAREVPKNDFYYLQFFNLIMKKCLEFLNLQLVGRNFYDAHSKIDISQFKLELWPGYFTSIREHERNILMCAEITHKVMRQETLLDMWINCLQTERKPQEAFIDQVKGTVVLTGYNNNTYNIQDVDFKLKPDSTFKLKTGESISYQNYYKNRYQLKVTYADQPLLIAKPKQKIRNMNTNISDQVIYLVPEFCRATGLTEKMRSNFNLMKSLSIHTRVSPEARMKKLLHFNRRLCSEPNIISELENWNLKLENKLIEVPGRVLPYENIVYGSRTKSATSEANWTKDLRSNRFVTCNPLESWILIQTSFTRAECETFLKNLMKAADGMGFNIKRPEMIIIRDDRLGTYLEALESYLSKKRTQFVFCILPHIRADRYNAIKKKCCVDRPVPSQVVVQKNLVKGLSVATKVAIQMNCKLGGVPWYVEVPLTGLMVIGFDVCHGKQSGNYSAIVASINNSLSRYISAVSSHTYGEELSNDIATHICKFVTVYRNLNNKLPDRIVIYRDGVGEGQIEQVYQHEVKEIRQKLQKLYGGQVVKLAVIVVNKRVNSRLFYHGGNPPSGTIVDDVITSRVKYDFFIVSQYVTQGTVTPTSYSVIDDNVGLDADKMQRLTYKLTHMYYNWSGTVRVPAPCQYAHKLAYLISENIKTIPNVRLEQLLYYL